MTSSCSPHEHKIRKRISWLLLVAALVFVAIQGSILRDTQLEQQGLERRLRVAVAGGQVGLWEWDVPASPVFEPESRVWYSPLFAELVGESTLPMTAAALLDRLHPDDVVHVKTELRRALLAGTPYRVSCRLYIKDRGYHWFSARGEVVEYRGGRAAVMAGAVVDMHERRVQAERARAIVSTAPVAMILCGPARRITVYNPAAEELFGWSAAEIEGELLGKLIHPDFAAVHRAVFDASLAALEEADANSRITRQAKSVAVTATNKEVPIQLTIRGIKYEGRIEFVVVARSIEDAPAGVEPLRKLPNK